MGNAPIRDDELEDLFDSLRGARGIALAVSGGPDSLALLDLVDRWRRRIADAPAIIVLTVDHGLRRGSASEAGMVAGIAAARGLRHRTLIWSGAKPATSIEATARDARYALLAEAAPAEGASVVVTAHHQEDQAETLLLRLGRGSGLTGLGGMRARRSLAPGLDLARPLLGVAKARLVATALAAGFAPALDESNDDPRFARARLRRLMPALAAEGIDAPGLARTAARLARADEALEAVAGDVIAMAATSSEFGEVTIARAPFVAAPGEIRLRVLARIIGAVGGEDWPPRTEKLEAMVDVITAPGTSRRTLGGAVVTVAVEAVTVFREAGRAGLPQAPVGPGFAGVWDHRFAIRVGADAHGLTVGALGEEGYRALDRDSLPTRPKALLVTLPAFRQEGRIVAVPPLGQRGPQLPGIEARSILAEVLGTGAGPAADHPGPAGR